MTDPGYNPDHDTDTDDVTQFARIWDSDGNPISPKSTEVDPDWSDWINGELTDGTEEEGGESLTDDELMARAVTANNCGVGPEGFQQGNTCAKGGGVAEGAEFKIKSGEFAGETARIYKVLTHGYVSVELRKKKGWSNDAKFIPVSDLDLEGKGSEGVPKQHRVSEPEPAEEQRVLGASVRLQTTPLPEGHGLRAKRWSNGLTEKEEEAVDEWSGGMYSQIREEFKSGELSSTSRAFLRAVKKAPTLKGDVYRGIKEEHMERTLKKITEAGVGGTFTDKAPFSMSRNPEEAYRDFGGSSLMMRVKSKTGRVIESAGMSGESEVIALPKTRYRVAAIRQDFEVGYGKSKWFVDLEEI